MYFDDYALESEDRKSLLRQTQSNIVENIHYWLQPIKPAPKMFDQTELKPTDASQVIKYVENQAKFLKEQTSYLEAHSSSIISNNFPVADLRQSSVTKFLADFTVPNIKVIDQEKALFSIDSYYSPYYEAIRVYDGTIQFLRSVIDDIAQT